MTSSDYHSASLLLAVGEMHLLIHSFFTPFVIWLSLHCSMQAILSKTILVLSVSKSKDLFQSSCSSAFLKHVTLVAMLCLCCLEITLLLFCYLWGCLYCLVDSFPLKCCRPQDLLLLLILLLLFYFLGLHLWHKEVPKLEVESELQLLAYVTATLDLSHVCNLHHSSQQHWILDPLSKARDQTRILMDTNQIHGSGATVGTPQAVYSLQNFSLIFCLPGCPFTSSNTQRT